MTLRRYMNIIRLGAPILVGQLGMIVVGFADTTMVGRYSTDALASASFVNNLFNVAIFACIGLTYGITPLCGALFGRNRHAEIGAMLRTALPFNIAVAIGIMGIMTAIYFNLHKLGQPEQLLPLIRPYFLLYLAGVIPIAVFNVFAQWAYSINRTLMPMWLILAANAINVAGNWLLIYGNLGCPELGLTGAGIATLASRFIAPAGIVAIFFLKRCYAEYSTGFRKAKITRENLRKINATSWPVSLQMTFESGSFSAAAVMAGWLGAIELASFQVLIILGSLGFCVYYSMASAISVLVSNASGRSDHAEMRHIAFSGYHILLLLAAIASMLFIFAGHPLIEIFTRDPLVVACAMTLIYPMVLYQLGDATQICFANALRGTSHVMPMLWIAFVSYVVVGLPATYLLGFTAGMGIIGIVLSFSVSLFLAGGLFVYFFMRATSPQKS